MLQLEQDLLQRLIDAQVRGIDRQFRIFRYLVGIGYAGEFRNQPRPRLGVKTFTVTRFTGFDGGGDVNFDKAANRFDHGPHVAAGQSVGRDRRADGDAPVLGDLGGDKPIRRTLNRCCMSIECC